MDFPAKILLFGEYGVLLNSMALGIPFPHFSGHLSSRAGSEYQPSVSEKASNSQLLKLCSFFRSHAPRFDFLQLDRLERDVHKGLFFASTIQQGSGLGSSGALTAALHSGYAIGSHRNDYLRIRTELAAIENFFHGLSSGFDPLISLTNKPVILNHPSGESGDIDLSCFLNTYSLFLINTRSKAKTGNLVARFREQYATASFRQLIDAQYLPIINRTIDAVMKSDFVAFESSIRSYGRFQLDHFRELISSEMIKLFEQGIEGGGLHLKICGSGGGGFLLGITRDRKGAETVLKEKHLDYLIV